ncbi:MAG: type II secretion system protein [Patescibacteria group bacterium]|nr:type II secretion system protein [Patescibacteria group bacterium]
MPGSNRQDYHPWHALGRGHRGHRRGFTLLETVVVVGLFAIVVITVVNIWLSSTRQERVSVQRQKITAEANILLDQISREIRTYELAFYGTLDYDGIAPAETLYTLDGSDAGKPATIVSNIYQVENELVLYDNLGDNDPTNDTVIAYAFWPSGTHKCADDSGDTPGFFRFYQSYDTVNDQTVITCERLFDFPSGTPNESSVQVIGAGFFFSSSTNPYPDIFDPTTDFRSGTGPNLDADCGSGTGAEFSNGTFCKCTAANQATACFTKQCNTTTGGRCELQNFQPMVTFYFTVQDANNPGTRMTFQTTATQRVYKR